MFSLLLVALLTVVALGRSAIAQEAPPVAAPASVHPVIGTWLANTDAETPDGSRSQVIFFADGGSIEDDSEEGGDVGIGRWQPTRDQTAHLAIAFVGVTDEDTYDVLFKVRVNADVAADGETFTTQHSGEFIQLHRAGSGEQAPRSATGEPISAEPMGAPIGSFEELFGQFEEATPQP